MIKDDYIVTKVLDHYDVWNMDTDALYTVNMKRGHETCSCPHWNYRIKRIGSRCKHHEIIDVQGAWNEHINVDKILKQKRRRKK